MVPPPPPTEPITIMEPVSAPMDDFIVIEQQSRAAAEAAVSRSEPQSPTVSPPSSLGRKSGTLVVASAGAAPSSTLSSPARKRLSGTWPRRYATHSNSNSNSNSNNPAAVDQPPPSASPTQTGGPPTPSGGKGMRYGALPWRSPKTTSAKGPMGQVPFTGRKSKKNRDDEAAFEDDTNIGFPESVEHISHVGITQEGVFELRNPPNELLDFFRAPEDDVGVGMLASLPESPREGFETQSRRSVLGGAYSSTGAPKLPTSSSSSTHSQHGEDPLVTIQRLNLQMATLAHENQYLRLRQNSLEDQVAELRTMLLELQTQGYQHLLGPSALADPVAPVAAAPAPATTTGAAAAASAPVSMFAGRNSTGSAGIKSSFTQPVPARSQPGSPTRMMTAASLNRLSSSWHSSAPTRFVEPVMSVDEESFDTESSGLHEIDGYASETGATAPGGRRPRRASVDSLSDSELMPRRDKSMLRSPVPSLNVGAIDGADADDDDDAAPQSQQAVQSARLARFRAMRNPALAALDDSRRRSVSTGSIGSSALGKDPSAGTDAMSPRGNNSGGNTPKKRLIAASRRVSAALRPSWATASSSPRVKGVAEAS